MAGVCDLFGGWREDEGEEREAGTACEVKIQLLQQKADIAACLASVSCWSIVGRFLSTVLRITMSAEQDPIAGAVEQINQDVGSQKGFFGQLIKSIFEVSFAIVCIDHADF